MTEHPLGLPQGSIRAILAIVIVIGIIGAILLGNKIAIEKLSPMAFAVITLYFGGRSDWTKEKKENTNGGAAESE